MTTTELQLLALLIVFALPWGLWRLIGQPAWAPLVVVQILGGILLGPGVLGALAPALHGALFTPPVIGGLNAVALWAVTLFVFLAGLELDLSDARRHWRETGLVASLALALPLALGAGLAWAFLTGPAWLGPGASPWQASLGLGMACAVTALPILVLFLDELALLKTPLGQRVLRYASLDDIAIWVVLALILLDWDRALRQLGFLLIFVTLSLPCRRLILASAPRHRWHWALIWLLAVALIADWAGLHAMVGAFLAGAVLDRRWFEAPGADQMRATVLALLMPVFFLSTGLRTDFGLSGPIVVLAAALLLAAAVGGKLLGVALAGRLLGWPRGEAAIIGWLLQTKALILIIFATVLLDKAILSPAAFTALLLMALASTALTMPIVGPRLRGTAR